MIEKLDVDKLFSNENDYEYEKRKFIAEYKTYIPGGLLSLGYYKNEPIVAEAKWNKWYPHGFVDWRESEGRCAYSDLKVFADKINEITEAVSNLSLRE